MVPGPSSRDLVSPEPQWLQLIEGDNSRIPAVGDGATQTWMPSTEEALPEGSLEPLTQEGCTQTHATGWKARAHNEPDFLQGRC